MEEKVEIAILLNLYGNLLTKTQKKYMDLYYNQDLSLSEIGDNENITRQAVNRNLLYSKAKLYEYEKKLKFLQKEKQIKSLIEKYYNQEKTEKNKDKIIEKINKWLDV